MRAGSLCTGIGGLDLAVEAHFGAALAWYAEVEPAPCTVLEREWPGVPNLRDLTAVDWSSVEPVDVLSAGYPCQPFSHAGKRKGADDVRHLWPHVTEAVRVLRPRWVVLENVAGHLTLGFGDVLRDLAEAGFDAEWCVLRASDVGAPHQRARLFIVARDADRSRADARTSTGSPRPAVGERRGVATDADRRGRDAAGLTGVGRPLEVRGGHPRDAAAPSDAGPDAPADANPPGPQGPQPAGRRHMPAGSGGSAALAVAWGQYEPAIRRWEHVLGRPAPRPTDDAGRLSPAFVEWMQGYPQGWVDGLTRTQALKALGNAVVPQQGYAALAELASLEERAA